MRWIKFIFSALAIVLICVILLPRLARVRQLEVVRNNIENSIDATAYFYNDIEDFSRFEKALNENQNRDS